MTAERIVRKFMLPIFLDSEAFQSEFKKAE
jgi:hypothetical protein